MRVLGISGSPRGHRSGSRRLTECVLEAARTAGAEVELVDLGEVHVDYCVACDACHSRGECSRTDDFAPIRGRMLAADGLVFGSPLYFNSVTAQLKTVIDRLAEVIHCQLFLGKYAGSVCVSGGAEHDLGVSYMNDVLLRLGCAVVGGVGASRSIPGSFEVGERDAAHLGGDLVQAAREQRTYPEQDAVHAAMHERFKRLITLNQERWPHEYAYWRAQNWLD